jgi:hypothetical protein
MEGALTYCSQLLRVHGFNDGLDVLRMVTISMLVFWVVTPCGLAGRYRRFGGTYRLHLQDWGVAIAVEGLIRPTARIKRH